VSLLVKFKAENKFVGFNFVRHTFAFLSKEIMISDVIVNSKCTHKIEMGATIFCKVGNFAIECNEKRSHFKLKSQEKKSFITQIYVSLRQLKSSFPTVAICGSRERKKKRILRSGFHNLPAFTETDQTKISYNKGSHFKHRKGPFSSA